MTMLAERFYVAVIMQKTALANRWVSERWEPVAVEPCETVGARVFRVADRDGNPRWRFEGQAIDLLPTEGEGYFLNLAAPDPKVFVMWRMLEPEAITAEGPAAAPFVVSVSYNQAARLMDGGEQVDSVPMRAEIRAVVEPFMKAHYKPEPRRKIRRRDPLADSGDAAIDSGTRS